MLSLCSALLCLATVADAKFHEIERALLQEQKFEEARKLLRTAVDVDPADTEAWLLLGRAYAGEGDRLPAASEEQWLLAEEHYLQAESAFRHAIDLDPERSQSWVGLGDSLLKMGRAEEAVATLYHAMSLAPCSLETRVQLADSLMTARSFDLQNQSYDQAHARLVEAEQVLREGTSDLDLQADLLRGLGDVLTAKGENEEALTSYRRAITIRPTDLRIHDAHILAMETSKRFDETIAFYQGLVDEPALGRWYGARSHELKGHVAYNVDKDFEAAVEEYQSAEDGMFDSARTNPEYIDSANDQVPLLRSYQGYAHMRAGNLEQAEAAFLAALDRDPSLKNARAGLKSLVDEYWSKMGGEGANQEDFDRIRAFTARLCVAVPDDADNWNNYGFFSREARRYEESYQAYRRSMSLAPDNARIINDTALILVYHLHRDLDLAAEWLWEARDLAEEEQCVARESQDRNRIAAADETYGDTLVNLVVLYHQMGELEQAREVLARVKEEMPDRYEIPHWHGILLPGQPHEETLPPDLDQSETVAAAKDGTEEGDAGGE